MSVVLPEQLDQIVVPVNSLGAQADRHAVAWARGHGLIRTEKAHQRLVKTKPGSLAAHCYPSANLPELCLLGNWMTWLFILDDLNDEGTYGWDPEALEQALTSVIFPDSFGFGNTENPFGAALDDMAKRAGAHMSPQWRHRFQHHVLDYFRAYVWQSAHRREGQIPDADTFPQQRREAGAIIPSLDLIEFVESTTLPPGLYYSRTYQRLLTTAANVVCWTNDLMTFEKEIARGDHQNLISVVSQAEDLTLDQAIATVRTRTGHEIERFLATEADLPRLFAALAVSPELQATALRCVDMLKAWMRGHVDWGKETARYLEFERSASPPEYLDDLLAEAPTISRKAETP
ncbi:hypothetical protein OG948_56495 (plasmid) [Embleya sp. NBC_00888]|uniref:terpene synthase family protein n=1 Tax=Embleya sp. NBC_00888 TaxID=2975960 RepID=UPI002F916586|nr:hypothetical protein OG948_56495 [Embleya sp. NBC_00888]